MNGVEVVDVTNEQPINADVGFYLWKTNMEKRKIIIINKFYQLNTIRFIV